jgi:hypothetical protein
MASQMQQPSSETAGHVAEQASEKIDQAVDMAKQQTASRLEDERDRVADSLYTTAHALRQMSQQLREREQGIVASAAERTAQQAERASGYLRSRDLSALVSDTEQVGRSHPVLFMGGALGLGLLGVRFLKSSRRQQTPALSQSTPASTPTTGVPATGYQTNPVLDGPADAGPLAATDDTMTTQICDEYSDVADTAGESGTIDGEEQTLGTSASRTSRGRR